MRQGGPLSRAWSNRSHMWLVSRSAMVKYTPVCAALKAVSGSLWCAFRGRLSLSACQSLARFSTFCLLSMVRSVNKSTSCALERYSRTVRWMRFVHLRCALVRSHLAQAPSEADLIGLDTSTIPAEWVLKPDGTPSPGEPTRLRPGMRLGGWLCLFIVQACVRSCTAQWRKLRRTSDSAWQPTSRKLPRRSPSRLEALLRNWSARCAQRRSAFMWILRQR